MYRSLIIVLLLLSQRWAAGSPEQPLPPLPTPPPKPGHYLHQLHGASGWYMPDNSGKYRHEPKPYDGGYGDRGQPYGNDLRGIFRQAEEQLAASVQNARQNFALGPRDHLRFMIDFNYNGTGWQIIKFEWVRDGDGNNEDQRQYSYVNSNRLWETDNPSQSHAESTVHAYEYEQPQAAVAETNCEPEPDCEPEQPKDVYQAEQNSMEVQSTINEVLEYIQQHILPNLN